MRPIEKMLLKAGNQHGVIARFQFSEIDVPASTMERHLKSPIFTRHCQGTYSIFASPDTWGKRASIAVFSCGPNSFLSHTSALINSGLLPKSFVSHTTENTSFDIHVVSPRESRFLKEIVFHRSTSIDNKYEPEIINGIPQTRIERAIIESAQEIGKTNLDNVVFHAFRRNLTNPRKLKSALDELNTAPGREKMELTKLLLPYLSKSSGPNKIESVLEKRVFNVLNQNTDYRVLPQFEISVGKSKYRADFALPDQRVIVEVDGHEFHRTRSQLDSDRLRQNDIVSKGWKVVRVTAKFTNHQILDAVCSVAGPAR